MLVTSDLAVAPVWKNAQLGHFDSIDAYRAEIQAQQFKIGSWGDIIVRKIWLLGKAVQVPLYLRTMDDYGLTSDSSYDLLFERVSRDGFVHCPPETLLALRLLYTDQPRGEWVGVGLEDLDARTPLLLCGIGHDFEGRWLCGGGRPEFCWHTQTPFVFTRLQ